MGKVSWRDKNTVVFYDRCPLHDDRNPSLWAKYTLSDKKFIIKCFAGCKIGDDIRRDVYRQIMSFISDNGHLESDISNSHSQIVCDSFGDKRLTKVNYRIKDNSDNFSRFLSDRCIDVDIADKFLHECYVRISGNDYSAILIRYCDIDSGNLRDAQIRLLDDTIGKLRYLSLSNDKLSLIHFCPRSRYVILVEGVLKGLSVFTHLRSVGCHDKYNIVCAQSSNNYDVEKLKRFIVSNRVRKMFVIYDADQPGLMFANKVSCYLENIIRVVPVGTDYVANCLSVRLEDESGKRGIDDVLSICKRSNIQVNLDNILESVDTIPKAIRASDVSFVSPKFLFENIIPVSSITVLEGDPGVGKSYLCSALSVSVSSGRNIYSKYGVICVNDMGTSLMFVSEDDVGIIGSRCHSINKSGANLDNVYISDYLFRLPKDIGIFYDMLDKYKPKLVVIDPIMNYIDKDINIYNDRDVRSVLSGLASVAKEIECAIVIVRHLRKGGPIKESNDVYRGLGSIGFVGLSRNVLTVDREGDISVLRVTKSNYADLNYTFRYKVIDLEVR